MLRDIQNAKNIKQAKLLSDGVGKTYAPPVTLYEDTLVDDLVAFVQCAVSKSSVLAKGVKTIDGLVAILSSRDNVRKLETALSRKILETASGLGTHVPKFVNSQIGQGAFTYSPPENLDIPFLCTPTTAARRKVGSSSTGGARHTPGFRFHRAHFVFRGETMILAHAIRDYPVIRQALVDAGFTEKFIESVRLAVSQPNLPKTDLDSKFQTLMWPMGDGSYRQLSPVPSLPVLTEIRFRVGEGFSAPADAGKRRYFTRRKSYGSKTQNVSIELLDAGGATDLLLSLPPPVRSMGSLGRILAGVKTGASLSGTRSMPGWLVDHLNNSMGPRRTPNERNAAYMGALVRVATHFLSKVIELRQVVEEGLEIDFALIRDPHERALVELGPTKASDEVKVTVARRLATYIAGSDDILVGFVGDRALPALFDAIEIALVGTGDEFVEDAPLGEDPVQGDETIDEEGNEP